MPGVSFDKKSVMSVEEFEDFELKTDAVKVNNFVLADSKEFLGPITRVKVSFSVSNRKPETLKLNAMVAGTTESGEILWALHLAPGFNRVSGNSNEVVTDSSYLPHEDLKKTKQVWIRVVGDFDEDE